MVVAEPQSQTSVDRAATLRCIDTDIHNDLPSYEELRPFLASEWHPWLEGNVPAAPAAITQTWAPAGWTTRCGRRTTSAPAIPSGWSSN